MEKVQSILKRIEKRNPIINAFTSIEKQENIMAMVNSPGQLKNWIVGSKDNISIGSTTCSSHILKGYQAPYEATVISKLRKEGAILIGKTNMDEFGMGSFTVHTCYGPTLNPVDETRVSGGSSGGSAAAVAAGFCDVALGSDTGGSVRLPAAYCGVVGFKPSYGRISRWGLIPYAHSLDTIGIFSKTVHDSKTVYGTFL
jgi:aspartyl-tRNA(Asn)/glutamyl-tRNA(Gln) amidotransferase subunit A